MASIISAGTTDSTSLNVSGDKTGILQLASNNAVTAVTIDASQNVGIGTASPTEKLDVQSSGDLKARIYTTGTTVSTHSGLTLKTGSYEYLIQNFTSTAGSAGALRFYDITAGSERMRIDSSGNVGIGVTPSSWSSGYRALQFGVGGTKYFSVSGNSAGAADGNLLWNAYSTGNETFAYITTGDVVTRFRQSGDFTWSTAPSGTAGGAITFVERMKLNSSGQLIMSTSTYGLNGQLQVGITASTSGMNSLFSVAGDQNGGYPIGSRGNSSTQGLIGFFDSSNSTIGSITKSGSSVAYNTSSDYRLKENIVPMTGALNIIAQLKPVTYKWKADGSDGQGFIAHELQAVVPDCVTGEKDAVETYRDEDGDEQTRPKYQGVDTSFLVATLTAAIQEQQAIINALTARIEVLENK